MAVRVVDVIGRSKPVGEVVAWAEPCKAYIRETLASPGQLNFGKGIYDVR